MLPPWLLSPELSPPVLPPWLLSPELLPPVFPPWLLPPVLPLLAITSTVIVAFASGLSTDVTVIVVIPSFLGVITPIEDTSATLSSLDE